MDLSTMNGFFKKYWKDRHAIGARGNLQGGLHQGGSRPSAGFVGPMPEKPPRTPLRVLPRKTYDMERIDAKMAALELLVQTKGATTSQQLDIDKLKAELVHFRKSGGYDERILTKLLFEAMHKKTAFTAAVNKTIRNDPTDIWEDVANILEEMKEVDGKKQPLVSDQLKDVATSGLSAFLGPVGPLFEIGTAFYKSVKRDGPKLVAMTEKWVAGGKKFLKNVKAAGAHAGTLYNRWTKKLGWGLDGILGKFGSFFGNLWDKFTGRGGKPKLGKTMGRSGGKLGRMAGVAESAIDLVGGNKAKVAATVASGLLTAYLAGSELNAPPAKDDGDSVTQKAAADSTPVTEKSPSVTAEAFTETLSQIGKSLGTLFTGLGSVVVGGWASMTQMAHRVSKQIGNLWDDTALTGRVLKDKGQEKQDQLWDDLKGWFNGVWERIKSFIPSGVRDMVSQAVSGTKGLLGIQDSASTGGDGSGSATQLNMTGGGTGDASKGVDAVKIAGGADTKDVNPAVMKNFYAMADEFHKSTGRSIQVNSGFRSKDQQAQLYAANPGKAARPGYSMHEFGYAIDINSAEANALDSTGLLAKYGFVRPLLNAGEPWHIEPLAIQGQKSAIRAGTAKMEQPGAIAAAAAGAGAGAGRGSQGVETEGATDKQLATAGGSSTPATDAQNAEQAKYKASDNYGDTAATGDKSGTASVEPMAATTSATPALATATIAAVAPATAPTTDSEANQRQASLNKQIEADIELGTPQPSYGVSGGSNSGLGVNHIPLYLGGLGLMTMNLGAA